MAEERFHRRLAAILAADVAGYSRLVREDEEGTLSALSSDIAEVFEPCVAAHDGRIFKTMGDGLLIEFASAVDAVRCAVQVQETMAARNAEREESRRIAFRMGINLGDVVTQDDDLQGDGINVAARLEGLATPGEVWISESVFEQVRDKLDYGFDDKGKHRVKNIARPVRTYRVASKAAGTGAAAQSGMKRLGGRRLYLLAAATAVLAVAIAGGLAIWLPKTPKVEPASLERMAYPLPDKPSIAVLPFNNLSDDESQEYFVDGMTEDLITDLSKISALFVISRNSVFVYKNRSVSTRQVAEDLGVRYVLEGSVRKAGGQVRINVQVIDSLTGGHLWADRYDGSDADIFALQDQVTQSIVAALKVSLTESEKDSYRQERHDNPQAYDAFLRGWNHYRRFTPEDFVEAIPHFERAIELEPDYGRAHAALAALYAESLRQGVAWFSRVTLDPIGAETVTRFQTQFKAQRHLREALKDPSPLAYQVSSMAKWQFRQFDAAIAEAVKAVALDPNDPDGHVALAWAMLFNGDPRAALSAIETAQRLDPQNPGGVYLYLLGLAQLGLNDFAAALPALEAARERSPDYLDMNIALVVAYTHLDRVDAARAAFERYLATWRSFSAKFDGTLGHWPFRRETDIRHFGEALIKVGFGTEEELNNYIEVLRLGGTLE